MVAIRWHAAAFHVATMPVFFGPGTAAPYLRSRSGGQLTCFQEMPALHQFLFGPIHRVFMLHRKWNESSTDLKGRSPEFSGSVSGFFCVDFKAGLRNLGA